MGGKRQRLTVMLLLTCGYFAAELAVGCITNSTALIADSFHMLSDVLALAIAIYCLMMCKRQSKRNTFGWVRAEILGALINSVFLLSLCLTIVIEASKRMIRPEKITDPIQLLIVGSIGLVINSVGIFLFHSHTSFGGHGHSHHFGHHHKQKIRPQADSTKIGESDLNASEISASSATTTTTTTITTANEMEESSIDYLYRKDSIMSTAHNISVLNDDSASDSCNEDQGVMNIPATDMASHSRPQSINCLDLATATTVRGAMNNFKKEERLKRSGGRHHQMNMHGVFLHILGDALGSVAVIVVALVTWKVDSPLVDYYLDPLLSLIIVVIISLSTVPLLVESALILLQTPPKKTDVTQLKKEISELNGVLGVHDLHVWRLSSQKIVATAHIHFSDLSEYLNSVKYISAIFSRNNILSFTVQPETQQMKEISRIDKDCKCLLGSTPTDNLQIMN